MVVQFSPLSSINSVTGLNVNISLSQYASRSICSKARRISARLATFQLRIRTASRVLYLGHCQQIDINQILMSHRFTELEISKQASETIEKTNIAMLLYFHPSNPIPRLMLGYHVKLTAAAGCASPVERCTPQKPKNGIREKGAYGQCGRGLKHITFSSFVRGAEQVVAVPHQVQVSSR